jgi:hypothetical protein
MMALRCARGVVKVKKVCSPANRVPWLAERGLARFDHCGSAGLVGLGSVGNPALLRIARCVPVGALVSEHRSVQQTYAKERMDEPHVRDARQAIGLAFNSIDWPGTGS